MQNFFLSFFILTSSIGFSFPFASAAILQIPPDLVEQMNLQRQRTGAAVLNFSMASSREESPIVGPGTSSAVAQVGLAQSSRDFIIKFKKRGASEVQEMTEHLPQFIGRSEFQNYAQDHPEVKLHLVKYYSRLGEVVLRLHYRDEKDLTDFRSMVTGVQTQLRTNKDVGHAEIAFFREKTIFSTR